MPLLHPGASLAFLRREDASPSSGLSSSRAVLSLCASVSGSTFPFKIRPSVTYWIKGPSCSSMTSSLPTSAMNLFPEKSPAQVLGGGAVRLLGGQNSNHNTREATKHRMDSQRKSQTLWLPHEKRSWLQRLRKGSSTLRVLC